MKSAPAYEPKSLIRRSVHALKWGYLGVATRIALQLAAQIVLARFLGPGAYGVVAAAVVIVLILGIFVEMGVGAALVQAPQLDSTDIRAAFTRLLLAAACASAIILVSADAVAALFGDPRVAPVLRWMTLALVFQSLGAIALGLLKRNLDFKTVQIAHVTSYFVGFVLVGITCAWFGAGEWSLVAAWVSQTLVASAIQYAKAPHALAPRMRSGSAPILPFGLRTAVASLANWCVENIDNLMVGRAFGTTTLGAYAIAYSLARTPTNHMVFSLQQVIQPFTARAQDDPEAVRKGYLVLLWLVSLITMPVFLGLGVLAPTAIQALYGALWSEAIPFLLPLALAMPVQAVQAVGGPVLWGSGRVGREIGVSVSVTVLLIVVLAAASLISAVAMAWGVFFAYLVRSMWITARVSEILGLPISISLSMLRGGLLVGAFVAAILYVADSLMIHIGMIPLYRLGAAVVLGAILLPLFVALLARLIVPAEIREVLWHVLQQFPKRVQVWFRPRIDAGMASGGQR